MILVILGVVGTLCAILILWSSLTSGTLKEHENYLVAAMLLGLFTALGLGIFVKTSGMFLKVCPQCTKKAVEVSETIVAKPTKYAEGRATRRERCRHCGNENEYSIPVARPM